MTSVESLLDPMCLFYSAQTSSYIGPKSLDQLQDWKKKWLGKRDKKRNNIHVMKTLYTL